MPWKQHLCPNQWVLVAAKIGWLETPSRSWKFRNYEKRNLMRMKGNKEWEIPLDLIWSWLDLEWVTWWLGEKLMVSDGRDRLSAPRLLQDLMIIELVRRWMNSNQTCECTYSDVRHPWQWWPESRFREFIRMTNWWPRLGAMTKFWTSILTVESQLVETLTKRMALMTIENDSHTFELHHRRHWTQYAWAHNLLQHLVQEGTEDQMSSTAVVRAQIPRQNVTGVC